MPSDSFSYVIFGAGRQGTAAAYDLIRFGRSRQIVLADRDLIQAEAAAKRLQDLTGSQAISICQVDVQDEEQIQKVLQGNDVALSAVPYYYNLAITRAAVRAGVSLCDMGGHTDTVRNQFEYHHVAHNRGISVVPDCGMGPGLVNTLGAFAMELLDEPREVYIYDAGLPKYPRPPWNYALTFHINGLTNEMDGQAVFIRAGQICYVDTLTEPEKIEIAPFGWLEADVTSGGTSLAPWTYLGKLERYENKVLRYPGHYEWLRAYKSLGLFSEDPIHIEGVEIVPRQVYHALLEPKINLGKIEDICVMRAIAKGSKNGEQAAVVVDLIDQFDPVTGFTAMERLTGWHCAIMMHFQARKIVQPGVSPVELAVPASQFMAEIQRRGIDFTVGWE